jgi:hypothetical protein
MRCPGGHEYRLASGEFDPVTFDLELKFAIE